MVASTGACYEVDGSLCAWVYERTDGNESLAGFADWFVERPLSILIIVIVAVVAQRLVRRAIERLMHRVVRPATSVAARLGRSQGAPEDRAAVIRDARSEARGASATAVLNSTATVAIWAMAVMAILGVVGIDLAPLIAGAGIAGIALGFGAQSLVRDCIAGLFMLIEDQLGIGDVVDLGTASGTVDRFSLRATVLRGDDGTMWHVPNGVVQRVGNRSQLWSVAVVDLDVEYRSDLDRMRELLQRAATDVAERPGIAERVLESPVVLGVERLGATGPTLRVSLKLVPGARVEIERALREQILRVFASEGVDLPAPPPPPPV